MIIAIHPDFWDAADGDRANSSSPKYAAILERAGHEVRWVDILRSDIISQVRGCDGFIWRHGHWTTMVQVAKRVLPVLERELNLVMYPDQRTCWHYDDKLAQKYLFDAHDIPMAKTWLHWDDLEATLSWARTATYPLVLKLAAGAASQNVRLISSYEELEPWVRRLMGQGVFNLDPENWQQPHRVLWGFHKNYVLLQEFLPDNPFDTRVTVIGGRAFAYRRFNRPNDFRASGSGRADYAQEPIDLRTIRLALECARRLGAQSLAFDFLRKSDDYVIGEVSYTYVSWMVHEVPGHWTAEGDPITAPLQWHDGHMWPEEAQMADYLVRLEKKRREKELCLATR
jgi:glutathione synthase/RimK-type ligase-like ATP-grasp enzyme